MRAHSAGVRKTNFIELRQRLGASIARALSQFPIPWLSGDSISWIDARITEATNAMIPQTLRSFEHGRIRADHDRQTLFGSGELLVGPVSAQIKRIVEKIIPYYFLFRDDACFQTLEKPAIASRC